VPTDIKIEEACRKLERTSENNHSKPRRRVLTWNEEIGKRISAKGEEKLPALLSKMKTKGL